MLGFFPSLVHTRMADMATVAARHRAHMISVGNPNALAVAAANGADSQLLQTPRQNVASTAAVAAAAAAAIAATTSPGAMDEVPYGVDRNSIGGASVVHDRYTINANIVGLLDVPANDRKLVQRLMFALLVMKAPNNEYDRSDYDRPCELRVEVTPESYRCLALGWTEAISDSDVDNLKALGNVKRVLVSLCPSQTDYTRNLLTVQLEFMRPSLQQILRADEQTLAAQHEAAAAANASNGTNGADSNGSATTTQPPKRKRGFFSFFGGQ